MDSPILPPLYAFLQKVVANPSQLILADDCPQCRGSKHPYISYGDCLLATHIPTSSKISVNTQGSGWAVIDLSDPRQKLLELLERSVRAMEAGTSTGSQENLIPPAELAHNLDWALEVVKKSHSIE